MQLGGFFIFFFSCGHRSTAINQVNRYTTDAKAKAKQRSAVGEDVETAFCCCLLLQGEERRESAHHWTLDSAEEEER